MNYISKKDLIFPKRKNKKGQNGKLLIIGGSEDYTGALTLAGHAALRSGTDWVTIAAPEKCAWAINTLSQDLVTKKLKGKRLSIKHIKEIQTLTKKHNTILIGNGIGTNSNSFTKQFLKNNKLAIVIDADAIKAISLADINNSILTPHKKEFEILLKNSKLTTSNFKKHLRNNIIILKGPIDKIITKNKTYYNKTGNPGMTKAGTGDVLAGLTAGFLSQNLTPLQSAINATYICGKLGDILLKKHKGFSFIASDLANEIGNFQKSLPPNSKY